MATRCTVVHNAWVMHAQRLHHLPARPQPPLLLPTLPPLGANLRCRAMVPFCLPFFLITGACTWCSSFSRTCTMCSGVRVLSQLQSMELVAAS